jgi:hypothetical protein
MRYALMALALLAGTAGAQAANDPDIASAQGNDPVPSGWEMRLDRPAASKATLRFVNMGPGMHVTSGPAAIYWNKDHAASGPFTAEVTFTQMRKPAHPEAFGLIWGGSELAGNAQEYLYFIVRGDGKYMVKHRAGDATHEIVPWTEHPGVAREDAAGKAKNTLRVDVTLLSSKLYANGQLVHEIPRAGMAENTAGIVGLRVNHNLDMHIDGFSIKRP